MKKLVKVLSILTIASLGVSFAGCQSKAEDKTDDYKVGVVQLVEHAALDAAYEGFIAGLKEAGIEEGVNLKLDYQNAQGDQSNCQTIATKLVNDSNDLILAIATPAAQAVANTTKDIPILVTAVTDPADSKLVASNETPGGNVTGTSDLTPVKEQVGLVKQIVPDAKTVGLFYCSSEQNSKFQVEIAKKALEELGLEWVEATVSSTNEIQQVAQSLIGKVDAIYIPTDNMLASGMATVAQVTTPAKLPVIVGEQGMVEAGGTATYGISYFNLGKLTGAQAAAILKEGKKPAEMPIEYASECELTINEEAFAAMEIEVSDELKAQLEK